MSTFKPRDTPPESDTNSDRRPYKYSTHHTHDHYTGRKYTGQPPSLSVSGSSTLAAAVDFDVLTGSTLATSALSVVMAAAL